VSQTCRPAKCIGPQVVRLSHEKREYRTSNEPVKSNVALSGSALRYRTEEAEEAAAVVVVLPQLTPRILAVLKAQEEEVAPTLLQSTLNILLERYSTVFL